MIHATPGPGWKSSGGHRRAGGFAAGVPGSSSPRRSGWARNGHPSRRDGPDPHPLARRAGSHCPGCPGRHPGCSLRSGRQRRRPRKPSSANRRRVNGRVKGRVKGRVNSRVKGRVKGRCKAGHQALVGWPGHALAAQGGRAAYHQQLPSTGYQPGARHRRRRSAASCPQAAPTSWPRLRRIVTAIPSSRSRAAIRSIRAMGLATQVWATGFIGIRLT